MKPELRALYEELGETVIEKQPPAAAAAAPAAALRAPAGALRSVGGAAATPKGQPPPTASYSLAGGSLAVEEVPQLRTLLAAKPDAVCTFLSSAYGRKVDPDEAKKLIDEIERALENPEPQLTKLRAFGAKKVVSPPDQFDFAGYKKDGKPVYDIDVSDTRFETKADWFRYAVRGGMHAALYHAGLLPLGPFRWHTSYPSQFRYALDQNVGSDLKIALFGDFANGYYHARYIADHIANSGSSYSIHVGDVYYAGGADETVRYLDEPLRPVINNGIDTFLLAGNHEMYAKGVPFLEYIDRKQAQGQRQEGTYFRLVRDGFQIVGIDTAWFNHARYDNPWLLQWMRDALVEGRAAGQVNILVSSNDPYEYGSTEPTKLFTKDVKSVADQGLIDLWFWGNTHYAALFNRSDAYRFVGSCIGHGGYPYSRRHQGKPSAAPVVWLEDGERFGDHALRPDMGNNGYCDMTLKTNGRVELRYIDWMGRLRHSNTLERKTDGTFSFVV